MVALLTEATLLNVNRAGTKRLGDCDFAADPSFAHYTRLRPERGDFSLVAEVSGRVVGGVWLLFLDAADPGYGVISGGVPELSVCVWPGYRGVVIGGLLLDGRSSLPERRGVRRIGLSVENGNPAKRLYRDRGFIEASGAVPGTIAVGLRPCSRARPAPRAARPAAGHSVGKRVRHTSVEWNCAKPSTR